MSPKSLVEKWVKELSYNKHKQTRECLSKDGAFCVLGLLCFLYSVNVKRLNFRKIDGVIHYGRSGPLKIPVEVINFLRPLQTSLCPYLDLVIMNDQGMTFREMIPFIEREFLGKHNKQGRRNSSRS